MAPMLFNIYIYDLPATQSKKCGYADNLAILFSNPSWEAVERGLTEDIKNFSLYLNNWRLKLSTAKTVTTMFHLCNKEAACESKILVNNSQLQYQPSPTYLGITL